MDGRAVGWSNGTVRAIATRVAASLRQGWRASLIVTIVVAVILGAVLTLVAGARRTATAPDRYTALVGGDFDGIVYQPLGRPRVDEIAALPSVDQLDSITFVGLTLGGSGDLNTFAGTGGGPGARLIQGRSTDPTHPEEFVANLSFAEAFGADVGDRFPAVTYTQAQVDANAFAEPPAGGSFEAVLVGLFDGPDDLNDPTPSAVFPMALLERDAGVVTTVMGVRLVAGASRDDLRAQLDALPGGTELALDDGPIVSASVRNAVAAQAQGLSVIALVAGLAAIATLGQILGRHSRVSEAERRRLVALGASRGQIVGEALGRASVPAALGLAIGMLAAALASQLFPVAFVRRLEPSPGLHVDARLLVPLATGLLLCLLGWVLVVAWLGQRGRTTERPSTLVEPVATKARTASAAAGLRFAFVRSPREAGSVGGTVVGLTVAVVGLVGASAFAVSLARLVADGGRFGSNYDVLLGNGWLPAGSDLEAALAGDDDIAGLMLLGAGAASAGTTTVELVGIDPVRGGLMPRLLDGRLPASADEVALGRLTARQHDVGVGDELTLQGHDAPVTFRVVGLAVVPMLGVNEGVGKGALLTFDGVHQLAPDVTRSMAAIVLRPGAPPDVVQRLGELTFTPPSQGSAPASIVNVARVDLVPVLLAGLLALLAAVLLAHALVQSVRSRRGDYAILRALGVDRRGVGRAVHWQATALVVVPLAVGIPVGLLLGRLVYAAFVERIGAVPDPTTPVLLAVVTIGGFLLLANVVGAVPARRAQQVPPARLLRAE
ncbi:MAG TPA: FtsX-like permease family protein [Acidimicrobiales bacterium]|nr:FtsX-like permease family protein [Acidimicrobiales bacterium]